MESTWGENTSFRKNYGIYFNDFIPLLIFSFISLFVDLSLHLLGCYNSSRGGTRYSGNLLAVHHVKSNICTFYKLWNVVFSLDTTGTYESEDDQHIM